MAKKSEFQVWLINKGMRANTAASVCSRVNRIKRIPEKYYKQGPDNYKVDLVDFDDKFKQAHPPS